MKGINPKFDTVFIFVILSIVSLPLSHSGIALFTKAPPLLGTLFYASPIYLIGLVCAIYVYPVMRACHKNKVKRRA
jgi:hypothetical protein